MYIRIKLNQNLGHTYRLLNLVLMLQKRQHAW